MRRRAFGLYVGLALLASAGQAAAQQRQALGRLACAEAMAIVKQAGEATLSFGPEPPQRYVRDRSFCGFSEIAELRFVPTRDNAQCPIGYRCREPSFEDWDLQ